MIVTLTPRKQTIGRFLQHIKAESETKYMAVLFFAVMVTTSKRGNNSVSVIHSHYNCSFRREEFTLLYITTELLAHGTKRIQKLSSMPRPLSL